MATAGDSCELFLLERIYSFATTDRLFCYCRHVEEEYIFCEVVAGGAPTGDRQPAPPEAAPAAPELQLVATRSSNPGRARRYMRESWRETEETTAVRVVTGGEGARHLRRQRCVDGGADTLECCNHGALDGRSCHQSMGNFSQ